MGGRRSREWNPDFGKPAPRFLNSVFTSGAAHWSISAFLPAWQVYGLKIHLLVVVVVVVVVVVHAQQTL